MRAPFPPLLGLAGLALSCGHAARSAPAPGDPVAERCASGPGEGCCEALRAKGEALLARNDRPAALTTYRRARVECPLDLAVRRGLHLASADPVAAGGPPAARMSMTATYKLRLPADARVVWAAVFLDGVLVDERPREVAPGPHVITEEVFVRHGGELVQLSAEQTIEIAPQPEPARMEARVTMTVEGREAAQPAERFSLKIERVEITGPTQPGPRAEPATLPPEVIDGLLLKQGEFLLPAAMKLPGAIYTVNTKLCTRDDGTVSSVAILRSSDQPMVDAAVLSALFPRLYDPYRQSGKAIPFCHPVQTTFNVGSGRQR